MARTVEEILAHADDLATRFETYVPQPGDELDVAAVKALRPAWKTEMSGYAQTVPSPGVMF